jgi:hypothetical protein
MWMLGSRHVADESKGKRGFLGRRPRYFFVSPDVVRNVSPVG